MREKAVYLKTIIHRERPLALAHVRYAIGGPLVLRTTVQVGSSPAPPPRGVRGAGRWGAPVIRWDPTAPHSPSVVVAEGGSIV